MTKTKTKRITEIALRIALAIVMSTWFKIPLISDIKLDLSYVVLAVTILEGDWFGSIMVGGMTAFLGSLFFSAYGLSPSWILANIVTAVIGVAFVKAAKGNQWIEGVGLIVAIAIGMLFVKTMVECTLYSIPLAVKLPKNSVAFLADGICMMIGFVVDWHLPNRNK